MFQFVVNLYQISWLKLPSPTPSSPIIFKNLPGEVTRMILCGTFLNLGTCPVALVLRLLQHLILDCVLFSYDMHMVALVLRLLQLLIFSH